MRKKLDKTYVLYVLKETSYTPYMLAKRTGISHSTISRVINDKIVLTWETIAKIEEETNIDFKCDGHISFATKWHIENELNETSDAPKS